jgi:hypothetical protein
VIKDTQNEHPLFALSEEDRDFIVRFVLASGSLKDLAREYGVSYPTLRGRLDRLIARLTALIEGRPADAMSDLLATMVERGEITLSAARSIQELHRREYQRKEE